MKFKSFVFVFLFVFVLSFLSSTYSISEVRLTQGGLMSSFKDTSSVGFDNSMCTEGQDFIIQIDPMGCSPAVVRSDLLEEEPVPVFCKLQAIKVNPLIDVDSFRTVNIKGEYPPEVKTVGFYPSRSVLGENLKLNSLMWDEIGYAVIYLDRQPNESAMPDFVEGNLTAKITYDLENSFGVRRHTFYLPAMSEDEFDDRMGYYSFFDNLGYLRAEDVTENSASIVVYSGRYDSSFGNSRSGVVSKQKILGQRLQEGSESGTIYLPGLGCYSGVKFRLDNIDVKDTTAVLSVNSELVEVRKNDRFLNDECRVMSIDKSGIVQKVRINCDNQEGENLFELTINPSIELTIDGKTDSYYIGQRLWYDEKKSEYVYLAYANTEDYSRSSSKLNLVLMSTKRVYPSGFLDDRDILAAQYIFMGDRGTVANSLGGETVGAVKHFSNGDNFKIISDGEYEFNDKKIFVKGFGDLSNSPLDPEYQNEYTEALREFDKVIEDYSQEKYPSENTKTLSEEAAFFKIVLAYSLKQNVELTKFCEEFEEMFPDSNYYISDKCKNAVNLANTEISSFDVVVDGRVKNIELVEVDQPSAEEYGATIMISGPNIEDSILMQKGQIYPLSDSDYFRLLEVQENQVKLEVVVKQTSRIERITDSLISRTEILKLNEVQKFNTPYSFRLTDTNIEKVAKVTVVPVTNNVGTTAEFNFKVGIEKRAIQLTPEKTKERIETLEKTIGVFENVSNGMESVIEVTKGACLATGAALTAKNLITGFNGKTLARQEVMNAEGGWYEICGDRKDEKGVTYDSVDECLLKNSNLIDQEVERIVKVMNDQNERIKTLQENGEYIQKGDKFYEQDIIDTGKVTTAYADIIKSTVQNSFENEELKKGTKTLPLDSLLSVLNSEGYKQGVYNLEDLKKLERYAELYEQTGDEVYKDRFITAAMQVYEDSEDFRVYEDMRERATSVGLSSTPRITPARGKEVVGFYEGELVPSDFDKGNIPTGEPIQPIIYNHSIYYVILETTDSKNYFIKNVYNEDGKIAEKETEIKNYYNRFELIDERSYMNSYISDPVVRYYESGVYKGMPAVVPFDQQNGWYVYMKQTVSVLGNVASYDASERVNSFWLCNIGDNRMEDFSQGRTTDDVCQQINLATGQSTSSFPGLSSSKSSELIDKARRAIESASRSYEDGMKYATILNQKFAVGAPAVDSLSTKCQDVMSPKECNLMFNVCDPVICPTSRCDFGGKYAVRDVAQTGIIGSIALCLPNAKEGIAVPVCLTGVKAGLDNLNSVFGAYRDCLNESLVTGETTGVCDEIHSIYLCEFFWEQAVPLAKIAAPKLIGVATGQNAKGGGEYLGFQAAFKNAQDSVNFFVKNYALNSFNAFKFRSQEQVGSAVCKNFISLSYPSGTSFLEVLTESDSPPQFNANLEAISYSTVTNPPTDHYKVYFHIFAGNDRGAYYRVYLRGGGSSYYQDTNAGRLVASDYIPVGEYASETVDFRAPSGYNEICVVVNNEEECGFKQVSSSFASDYLRDSYIQRQINNSDISSESECISGSADLYTLLNPNLQAGVGDLLDPAIYNRGITRICSTENPGKGNDPNYPGENQRWIEVGNCGDRNIKCWIDKESVDDSLEFEYSKNQSIEDLERVLAESTDGFSGYLDEAGFASLIKDINDLRDFNEKLELIDESSKSVFRNNWKAKLILERGWTIYKIVDKKFKELLESQYNAKKIPGAAVGTGDSRTDSAYEGVFKEVTENTQDTFDQFFGDPGFISPVFIYTEDKKNLLDVNGDTPLFLTFDYVNGWRGKRKEKDSWSSSISTLSKMKDSDLYLASYLESHSTTTKDYLDSLNKALEYIEGNTDRASGLIVGEEVTLNFGGGGTSFYAGVAFRYNNKKFVVSDPEDTFGEKNVYLEYDKSRGWVVYITSSKKYYLKEKPVVVDDSWHGKEFNEVLKILGELNYLQGVAALYSYEDYGSYLLNGANDLVTYTVIGSDKEYSSLDNICENRCEGENYLLVDGSYDEEIGGCNYVKKECLDSCDEGSCEIVPEPCPNLCEDGFLSFNGEEVVSENGERVCQYETAKCIGECNPEGNLCRIQDKCPTSCIGSGKIEIGIDEGLEGSCSFFTFECEDECKDGFCNIKNKCETIDRIEVDGTILLGKINSGTGECDYESYDCNPEGSRYCNNPKICENKCVTSKTLGVEGKYDLERDECVYDESNLEVCSESCDSLEGRCTSSRICPDVCTGTYYLGVSGKYEESSNSCQYEESFCGEPCDILNSECTEQERVDGFYNIYYQYIFSDREFWIGSFSIENNFPSYSNQEYLNTETSQIQAVVDNTIGYFAPSLASYEKQVERMLDLENNQEKVLSAVSLLDGRIVPRPDTVNCFTAANSVYSFAGLGFAGFIYSEGTGTKVNVRGTEVILGVTKNSKGEIIFGPSDGAKQVGGLTEDEKLDLIEPGYLIDYVYNSGTAHSVIFVKWVDKEERIAETFDWLGGTLSSGEKSTFGDVCTGENFKQGNSVCYTYGNHNNVDLSDDAHFVFNIGKYY